MSAASDEARALRAEHMLLTEHVATQAAAQTRYADTMRQRLAQLEAERDGWLAAAFDLQDQRDRLATLEDARREQFRYDRDHLVDVLVHHARYGIGGCSCGEMRLGESYPEHIADVYEQVAADEDGVQWRTVVGKGPAKPAAKLAEPDGPVPCVTASCYAAAAGYPHWHRRINGVEQIVAGGVAGDKQ